MTPFGWRLMGSSVPGMGGDQLTLLGRVLAWVAQDDRLAALYVLAISLGLREGELLALRWDDVRARSSARQGVRHDRGCGGRTLSVPLGRLSA
jgi:integrase